MIGAASNAVKVGMVGVLYTQTATTTGASSSANCMTATGVGTLTLPANFFVAGKTIRLRVIGQIVAPTGGGTVLTLEFGGVSTGISQSISSGAGTVQFNWDILAVCRTTGTSGTIMLTTPGVAGTVMTLNTTISNLVAAILTTYGGTGSVSIFNATLEVLN